jgi:hypothetical protein
VNVDVGQLGWAIDWALTASKLGKGALDQLRVGGRVTANIEHCQIGVPATTWGMSDELDLHPVGLRTKENRQGGQNLVLNMTLPITCKQN